MALSRMCQRMAGRKFSGIARIALADLDRINPFDETKVVEPDSSPGNSNTTTTQSFDESNTRRRLTADDGDTHGLAGTPM